MNERFTPVSWDQADRNAKTAVWCGVDNTRVWVANVEEDFVPDEPGLVGSHLEGLVVVVDGYPLVEVDEEGAGGRRITATMFYDRGLFELFKGIQMRHLLCGGELHDWQHFGIVYPSSFFYQVDKEKGRIASRPPIKVVTSEGNRFGIFIGGEENEQFIMHSALPGVRDDDHLYSAKPVAILDARLLPGLFHMDPSVLRTAIEKFIDAQNKAARRIMTVVFEAILNLGLPVLVDFLERGPQSLTVPYSQDELQRLEDAIVWYDRDGRETMNR